MDGMATLYVIIINCTRGGWNGYLYVIIINCTRGGWKGYVVCDHNDLN